MAGKLMTDFSGWIHGDGTTGRHNWSVGANGETVTIVQVRDEGFSP